MTFNEVMMNKNLTMVFDGTTTIGSTKFRDANGNETIVDMADTKEVSDMNNVNTNNNVTVNTVAVEEVKEGSIMSKVAGVAKVVKGVAGNVVTKVTEVIKNKEDNTMDNTIKTNEVAVNDVVVKEDKDMTKAEMRKALEEAGVELSNTQFKKMLKAELKALLEDTLEAKEIKPVEVAPEKVEVEVVDRKEQNRRVLVSALVSVWVYQTTHKYQGKWSLFYDSKKYAGKKIASYKSLLKVTGDTVSALFGDQYNKYEVIKAAWETVAKAGYCSIDNNGFVSIDNNQWTNCLVLSKAVNQQAVRSNATSICGFLKGFTK